MLYLQKKCSDERRGYLLSSINENFTIRCGWIQVPKQGWKSVSYCLQPPLFSLLALSSDRLSPCSWEDARVYLQAYFDYKAGKPREESATLPPFPGKRTHIGPAGVLCPAGLVMVLMRILEHGDHD